MRFGVTCNTDRVLWPHRLAVVVVALSCCVPLVAAQAADNDDPTPPPPGVIAPGVSVGGVAVGGMTESQAAPWVAQSVLGTLTVSVGTQTWTVPTQALGLHAYITRPLQVALTRGRTTALDGQDIPVVTHIAGNALRTWLRSLAPKVKLAPVDAGFRLVNSAPVVVPDRWGRQLNVPAATALIVAALREPDRGTVVLPTKAVVPAVTARSLPPALVVDRTAHHVTLYSKTGAKIRTLGVAVGQPQYPTPTGALPDHPERAQPLVVSAERRLGRRREAGAPGPGQPARHALDGHQLSRRRPARNA